MSNSKPTPLTKAASDILSQTFSSLPIPINGTSQIHDYGCGDGEATTSVLLNHCKYRGIFTPQITATDTSLTATKARISTDPEWSTVKAIECDMHNPPFRPETFTLTVCNFRIAETRDPLDVLTKIHRMLQYKGIAIVTCWKSGVPEILDTAFRAAAGEGVVRLPGSDHVEEGHLLRLMEDAGWERGKIKPFVKSTLVKTVDLEELVEELSQSHAEARKGWSGEQNEMWKEEIEKAVESRRTGSGLELEAWVVLAKKWDQLTG